MLTLIGAALFCLLTALGTSDKSLLAGEGTVKIPFADAPISFMGFMIVAPLLLIGLTIYLHVFYGYWLELERERQAINRNLATTNETPLENAPSLFAYTDPMSRLLTSAIFYWLVPVVLAAITWKAAGRPDLSVSRILIYVTGLVTCALLFLGIRRCPESERRQQNPPRGAILCVVVVLLIVDTLYPEAFHRPLSLYRADLKEAWLPQVNLSGADMEHANLQEAKLWSADLQRAKLWSADLQGAQLWRANLRGASLWDADLRGAKLGMANLQGAHLPGAQLQGANLQDVNLQGAYLARADLRSANLQGADLQGADLQGADLQGANLRGANLREVTNLTREQIATANTDENTKLPGSLGSSHPTQPKGP